MPTHLSLLSGLAGSMLCLLFALLCLRGKARSLFGSVVDGIEQAQAKTPGSHLAASLAACASLAAFLCMPLGSLPALLPLAWGGLAVLGCLALALGFEESWGWNAATRRKLRVLALLGLALAIFAWCARQRGLPGELLSLDMYVATPLHETAGWRERIGMLLLGAAFLLALHDVQRELAIGLASVPRLEADAARAAIVVALARQIWIFAVLGMAVCLFIPLCPAYWLGLSGLTGIAVDALAFWLKVLLADHGLRPATKTLPRFSARRAWGQYALAGLGALCMAPV